MRFEKCSYAPPNPDPESNLATRCAGSRMAPTMPSDLKHTLETEKEFTNKGDTAVVAELYRTFFEAVAPSVEKLKFAQLGWGLVQIRAVHD